MRALTMEWMRDVEIPSEYIYILEQKNDLKWSDLAVSLGVVPALQILDLLGVPIKVLEWFPLQMTYQYWIEIQSRRVTRSQLDALVLKGLEDLEDLGTQWYENIKEGGVLCFVCDAPGHNVMRVICSRKNEGAFVDNTGVSWRYAEPCPKQFLLDHCYE